MSITIYVVRHGETDWNKIGRFQGSTDIELNETGIAQAQTAKEKLASIDFSKCIVSDLKRAQLTAKIICEERTKIITDSRIRELFCGDWEGKTNEEIKQSGDDIEKYFTDPLNHPPRNGETIQQLFVRATSVLNELLADTTLKEKNVLLVSHGGTIRTILSWVVQNSPNSYQNFFVENCGIAKILIETSGRRRILKLNS
jgi:broad specificity phosphatase PhoE